MTEESEYVSFSIQGEPGLLDNYSNFLMANMRGGRLVDRARISIQASGIILDQGRTWFALAQARHR